MGIHEMNPDANPVRSASDSCIAMADGDECVQRRDLKAPSNIQRTSTSLKLYRWYMPISIQFGSGHEPTMKRRGGHRPRGCTYGRSSGFPPRRWHMDEPMLWTNFKYDAPVRGCSLVFPVAGPPPGIERQLASEPFPIHFMLEPFDDGGPFIHRRSDVQLTIVASGHPGGLPVPVHLSRRLSVHVQLHECFSRTRVLLVVRELLDFPPPLDAEHGCAFTSVL